MLLAALIIVIIIIITVVTVTVTLSFSSWFWVELATYPIWDYLHSHSKIHFSSISAGFEKKLSSYHKNTQRQRSTWQPVKIKGWFNLWRKFCLNHHILNHWLLM